MYSFISDKKIIDSFKSSKYFKTDLGTVFMPAPKQGGEKKFDYTQQAGFMQDYLTKYGSKIYKEGNIGQIDFYTDYKMKATVVVYYDTHHFTFEHDANRMRDKGVDAYLGSIIKEIETNYIPQLINKKEAEAKSKQNGNDSRTAQEKIKTNPGEISYDDIKDYLKEKRFKR